MPFRFQTGSSYMTHSEAAKKASDAAKEINAKKVAERREAAIKKVDKDELINFYRVHTQADTIEYFGLAKWEFFYILKYYNIKKTRKDINILISESNKGIKRDIDKRRSNIIDKYGDWDTYRTQMVSNVKKTKLERYGNENYNNPDKGKQSLIEHYGSIEEANKAKVRSAQNTMTLRYGSVENCYKQAVAKSKTTNITRYGVECTLWADSIEPKIRATFLEKYGVPYYCMTAECKSETRNKSKINIKFSEFLELHGIEYSREFSIGTRSYDFQVGSTLIEIDPSITHNSSWTPFGNNEGIPELYHMNKSLLAENSGFRCIHVWDWDDWNKVIGLVQDKPRLYARKLFVKEVPIDVARQFLETNHLQGWCKGNRLLLGLYTMQDELVEIMTLGTPRYSSTAQWELLRLCSSNYRVVGGAEKLFSYFIKVYKPQSVISYCDRSKFIGNVYSRLGFKELQKASPSAHWVSVKTGKHITDNLLRQRGFDQLLGNEYGYFGKGTSNEQLMLNHGFVKLYDCGQQSYLYKC